MLKRNIRGKFYEKACELKNTLRITDYDGDISSDEMVLLISMMKLSQIKITSSEILSTVAAVIENANKPMEDNEYDIGFMKNEKYYYLVVTKSNAFLEKYLLKYNSDKFCLNCFCIF